MTVITSHMLTKMDAGSVSITSLARCWRIQSLGQRVYFFINCAYEFNYFHYYHIYLMRVFRFGITVVIEQVHLSVSFPCKLSVAWKRGNQKLESTTQPQLEQGLATFNESLSLQTRIYCDDKAVF